MSFNPKFRHWADQRVWLIGASTGIGASLAKRLIAAGATVALTARREKHLQDLLGNRQSKSFVAPCDVQDRAALEATAEQVIQRLGRIDLLVWLVGTYAPMRAGDYNADQAVQTLRVNYESLLYLLGKILPFMRKQRSGTLALVSSVAGYGGLPKSLAYGPTKAAMINLSETLYMDLKPDGVGVVLISPGFVDTPLTKQNDFKMPALISSDEAALEIIRGLEAGEFEIAFPKRFTNWLKGLRLMPYSVYFKTVSRFTGL